MKYEAKGDKILIQQKELDIYDAIELREFLLEKNGRITLDLKEVEVVSTPVVQILLSAKRSYKVFELENVQEGVKRCLYLLGTDLSSNVHVSQGYPDA